MKKLYIILLLLLLTGCIEGDRPAISLTQMIEDGGQSYLVHVESITETKQEHYNDGEVPKTYLEATCIHSFFDGCETNLVLSQKGGIDSNGDFVGVSNERSGNEEIMRTITDSENYILLAGEYYIVIVQEDDDSFHIVHWSIVREYDENLDVDSQTGNARNAIFSFEIEVGLRED